MASASIPEPARPSEVATAFRLLFRSLAGAEREVRVSHALHLVQRGELDPQGIFVLRDEDRVVGVLLCLPLPGATALVWPPQVLPHELGQWREDVLLQHACRWLRSRGIKLAQALLPPEVPPPGQALLRNGFTHLTHLWYLRHDLHVPLDFLSLPVRLDFPAYADGDPCLFHEVLLGTYQDTLDCPEINGLRTVEEIIAGHQSQGTYDPRQWWLARQRQTPVGVLITTAFPESRSWDLSYLGVLPQARRQGFGKEMLYHILAEARAAGAEVVTLCVDARNPPAWNLYINAGFVPFDRREVFLGSGRTHELRPPCQLLHRSAK